VKWHPNVNQQNSLVILTTVIVFHFCNISSLFQLLKSGTLSQASWTLLAVGNTVVLGEVCVLSDGAVSSVKVDASEEH